MATRRIAGINFVASQVIEDPRCRGPGAPRPPPDGPDARGRDRRGDRLPRRVLRQEADRSGCSAGRSPTTCGCRPPCAGRSPAGRPSAPLRRSTPLRKVRVPTLITHGRQDTVVLPAAAEMTAAAIPHARLSWFDDCGHSPFVRGRAALQRRAAGLRPVVPGQASLELEGIIPLPLFGDSPLPSYGRAFWPRSGQKRLGGAVIRDGGGKPQSNCRQVADHDLKSERAAASPSPSVAV